MKEHRDAQGKLDKLTIDCPKHFNFAYDVMDTIAQHEPNKTALGWANEDKEHHNFSFEEMRIWSNKTANYLSSLGIKKGDFVMVMLRRHYQFWFTALALEKIGAVCVPATFMLKEHDLEYRFEAAGIEHILCSNFGDSADMVDKVVEKFPNFKNKILVNGHGTSGKACSTRVKRSGWEDFNTGVSKASSEIDRIENLTEDPLLLYFSSGTSGEPKMVLHNHEYALAHIQTAKYWHDVDPDGLHFTIADTGWGKTVWGKLYGQWACEAAILVYDFNRFKAEDILHCLQDLKVTTFCCPPTMYRMIMLNGVDGFDLSSLQHCTTAGEMLNPDLFKYWKRATGHELCEGFGQTETTLCICVPADEKPVIGSMGKPSPLYTIELHRDDESVCDTGEVGEICIKIFPKNKNDKDPSHASAPGILDCYYKDEERTAEAKRNFWYHTGDLAWKDEDGYLFYVGRNDDVIKSSGYRIGPHEIESVMLEHDAVNECAITGEPDELRGMAVKATVVLSEHFKASEELTNELQQWVKNKTAPYKYPRIIEYVDELPKTISGKIQRAKIRKDYK